ncbi:lipoprotein signal peptidase [Helicobacter jaachi]|uniref:Lipoprotein signal peptidase n=1 Tax=Helicobacter jaachi TaxID=1677920 RepID=A0A4U8TCW4_9HELI|nr:signal peptidase II [Helicobacter jaachi]TLD97816.1 lipoprotein signal peptidase [Helicobacter jaachi]
MHFLGHIRKISARQIRLFLIFFLLSFVLDQLVKILMLKGFAWDSEALSIGGRALVYNTGVAFSMFSFLEEYLKYIQIVFLLCLLVGLLMSDLFTKHYVAFGILMGAGSSNIFDRFIHGGVVDYVYWHYWFDFAIFNLADVLIDVSVVLIIWQMLREKWQPHERL